MKLKFMTLTIVASYQPPNYNRTYATPLYLG
jgi:hypothetical protein